MTELGFQGFIVTGLILALIVFLYLELVNPAVLFSSVVVVMIISKIITPEEALDGFSNEQLGVIVLLLIFGNALRKTPIIELIFSKLFKKSDTIRSFTFKMIGSVGLTSGFINNTPLVAILMPYVYHWSRENRISASKLLIPLSYISILGGCLTLIGTSTNLIVNGLAMEYGAEELRVFDFLWVGLPMLVIGGIYLLIFGPKLLPNHKDNFEDILQQSRSFFIETHIKKGSGIIGKTVESAGLRNLTGGFLVEILRDDHVIRPVSPQDTLKENDILFFGGVSDTISQLTNPELGLSLPKECQIPLKERSEIVEVVVSHNSRLVGKPVRDSDFRGKYDGAILAIHRNGEKLWGTIGDLELKPGDVLLVLTGKDFYKRTENNPAFYVIAKIKKIEKQDNYKAMLLIGGLVISVVLASLNLVGLFVSLSVLLIISLLMKQISGNEIRTGMDFNLIVIIAFGLAVGKGMVNTGVAEWMAGSFVSVLKPYGMFALLIGMFFITNILASFMTSKAAVAITLPVAISIASATGADQMAYILIVAFGGAANFITPIGYQTNLMVYGPGRYSFRDFFKIGFPLTVIYMLVSSIIIYFLYGN